MSKNDSGGTGKSRLFEDEPFDGSDQQETILSGMLEMTSSLKASTTAANRLIKRDIRRLNEAMISAEGNIEHLKQTSNKLSTCSKEGMNWGLIVLVIIVFMIFMFMVFLMRVVKKN